MGKEYPIDCFMVAIEATGYSETFPGTRAGGFEALETFNLLVNASEDAQHSKLFTRLEIVLTIILTCGKIAHMLTN